MIRPLLIAAAALTLAGCVDQAGRVADPGKPAGPIELTRITPTAPSIAYYSGLAEATRLVISDPATFATVWNRAFEGTALPAVDFGRERVIVAALGQHDSGGYGIEIRSADVAGDEVVVEVVSTSPGKDCVVTAALTQPVDMVKVPRAGSAVRFSESSEVRDCSK